jgi:hypothetical protein
MIEWRSLFDFLGVAIAIFWVLKRRSLFDFYVGRSQYFVALGYYLASII